MLHRIPGSDEKEKTYVRFKTLESKTVFEQHLSLLFAEPRVYDGIVQMEAGFQEGQILDIKVWVFRETAAAERHKDKNGPVQLEVMHTEQSRDKVCLCLFCCNFNHHFAFVFWNKEHNYHGTWSIALI